MTDEQLPLSDDPLYSTMRVGPDEVVLPWAEYAALREAAELGLSAPTAMAELRETTVSSPAVTVDIHFDINDYTSSHSLDEALDVALRLKDLFTPLPDHPPA